MSSVDAEDLIARLPGGLARSCGQRLEPEAIRSTLINHPSEISSQFH